MVLVNKSRKMVLTQDLKEAKLLTDKLLGLLRPENPRSLLFKTRFGIHTFGLRVPIDVIILDKQFRVVKLKRSLPSNRLFFWNPKYSLVIELPEGSIDKSRTKTADTLKFLNN